ncbi:MAG TPA: ATP-binding cassette domain-containing protein [Acidimicrobiales bacterium]|nr:ATP-binding cassette domain-containing protein [Acidimicrobiales bacterium]
MIETITVLGGRGKNGDPDAVSSVDLTMGDVVSVVGATGSGKTTLINDIELFANANTPSGRRVLVNGKAVPTEFRNDPARHPIALITQHTTFLSDMPVEDFLATHARIRAASSPQAEELVGRTLAFADQLTGEPVPPRARMTELSGGQARALLIADATIVCATPIVLLDEVENAGIDRTRAVELLRRERKIFVFVTHDPRIALLSDYRVVMSNGTMSQLLRTDEQERRLLARVSKLDDLMARLRDAIRLGERLSPQFLERPLPVAQL